MPRVALVLLLFSHCLFTIAQGQALPYPKGNSNEEVPRVRITEFFAGKQFLPPDSLLKEDRVTIDHNTPGFSLSFTALTDWQEDQLAYYYILEGIDQEWMQSNVHQSVRYHFLPA